MNCKDCVHYVPCYIGRAIDCRHFKNKADFVEVVRCKDCIYKTLTDDGEYNPEDIVCGYHMSDGFDSYDFCSCGKREENTDG